MRLWVYWVVAFGSGCAFPPSAEQISCYQGCGREKDGCMLAATTPQQIQSCDERSSRCTAVCE
ncbi:MAG TPA: hypothetical protein VNG33_09700 [Polyangiaceae bacterium]|nr:hypothetical protein [Polyangiaceae bacterium]